MADDKKDATLANEIVIPVNSPVEKTAAQEEIERDRAAAEEQARIRAEGGQGVATPRPDSGYRFPEGYGTIPPDADMSRFPSAEKEGGDGGRSEKTELPKRGEGAPANKRAPAPGSNKGIGPEDYEGAWSKDELEAEAESRGLTVKGSGEGGRVLKADLVKALEKDDAK